jgi:hypothetical protein
VLHREERPDHLGNIGVFADVAVMGRRFAALD